MPTGGAHPDEHLGSARKAWFKVHLAALHRHAGETKAALLTKPEQAPLTKEQQGVI